MEHLLCQETGCKDPATHFVSYRLKTVPGIVGAHQEYLCEGHKDDLQADIAKADSSRFDSYRLGKISSFLIKLFGLRPPEIGGLELFLNES